MKERRNERNEKKRKLSRGKKSETN